MRERETRMNVKTGQVIDQSVKKWVELNDELREADEAACEKLIELELAGKARWGYVMRIHSRLNKARAERERAELKLKARKTR